MLSLFLAFFTMKKNSERKLEKKKEGYILVYIAGISRAYSPPPQAGLTCDFLFR